MRLDLVVRALLCALLVSHLTSEVRMASPLINRQDERTQGTVIISVTAGKPANTFIPAQTLGAGIDGHEEGETTRRLTPANINAMLSAGLSPLSYRLRTELAAESWHWNPRGKWSDSQRRRGYWISDDRPGAPISACYGYRLPRRGNTIDQANNDGYSRLADGNTESFWKSNPYFDRHFTGEDDAQHPQWVVIDLGQPQKINQMRLLWGIPYATQYAVEYWDGPETISPDQPLQGEWRRFDHGMMNSGSGGDVRWRLSEHPIAARFVRLILIAGSRKAPPGSRDLRDGFGYAIREVYLGLRDEAGRFNDAIRHHPRNDRQTVIYVSSTDPWHRAIDRDPRTEQPGVDLIYRSGLTRGMPLLLTSPLLYDTPENATALIQYLRARGYPVKQLELGEEPDGQPCAPEHYAALYLQWADALHQIAPNLQLGGPSFQSIDSDYQVWPERPDNRTWLGRFLDYLRARGRLNDFQFCSFEWYPFDDICAPSAPQLVLGPELLTKALKRLQASGLSPEIPRLMTEYGYSAFAGQSEIGIEGALLNADIVGLFLTLGGQAAYLYGYEPDELINEMGCSWGNNMLFGMDNAGRIKYRVATFHGARLLTQQWAGDPNQPHQVYPAESNIRNEQGQALVTAYAVYRPDGQWALLLINKDPQRAWSVNMQFYDTLARTKTPWRGSFDLYQFSSAQYIWKSDQHRGRAMRSDPPEHLSLEANPELSVRLPPYSLSVVRGRALNSIF